MKPVVAKKDFGQHFLVNEMYMDQMIKAAQFSLQDTVLEIGGGTGAMTRKIAPLVKKLIVLEPDRDLVVLLQEEFQNTNVQVIQSSVFDYVVSDRMKIWGNIPYYLSTSILEWILKQASFIDEAFLTVQTEFAQRLLAQAGGKKRGFLSVMMELLTETKVLFKVPSKAFNPRPRVESVFLKMKLYSSLSYSIDSMPILTQVIREAFSQKRKTIKNAFYSFSFDKIKEHVLLDKRAEQVSVEEFVFLSKQLSLKRTRNGTSNLLS